MKKLIMFAVLFCLASAPALADVSNEVVVGLKGDSTSKVESNYIADPESKIDTKNSLFTVQYTHFFTPLKDDDKPIDLRQFYQHPSTLSAGLAFIGQKDKDTRIPSDVKGSAGVLQFGGEYFFPTNTGLFLNIGFGGGTFEVTEGGVARPDRDVAIGMFGLGVRQYLVPNVALHLRLEAESTEATQSGSPDRTSDRSVVYFGGRGVIADMVGLTLEFGGGKVEDKQGGATIKSDIGAVNFEIAGYIGKQLTLRLALQAEEEKETGVPAGEEHKITTARTTLAARYWFSERFGMELPIYAESIEQKDTFPVIGEQTLKTTNNGIGLYAAFRF
jgi:hypothetical protein